MKTFNSFNSNVRNENNSVETVNNTLQNRFGKFSRVAFLVAVMVAAAVVPATAQVRLGVKGGITMAELQDKNSFLNENNHTAYTGGLMLDLNIPKVGLGLEVSALYRHSEHTKINKDSFKRINLDIPVYARYRLAIPGVERIIAPCVFTGPNISVLVKDDTDEKDLNYENSKTKLSWDVGAGVDLFNHLRLTVNYGIGMSKAMKVIGKEYDGKPVEGKDQCWTVSAAIMF